MSTSTSLSVNKQKGVIHIIFLFVILLVIGIIVLIFLGIQALKPLNLSPNRQTQYKNPFDQTAQYENPFDTYQNPFDQIQK